MNLTLPDMIAYVAEQSGMKSGKLSGQSRLLQDIGIDGDDAVEFFTDYETRYQVDLAPLYAHWDRHFGPEGFGTPLSILIMILLLAAPILFIPLGISPFWVWGVELVAVLLWLWPLRQWPLKDETIAITIADLASAAETKQWPLSYEEGV